VRRQGSFGAHRPSLEDGGRPPAGKHRRVCGNIAADLHERLADKLRAAYAGACVRRDAPRRPGLCGKERRLRRGNMEAIGNLRASPAHAPTDLAAWANRTATPSKL